jgi:hypothetical protein
MWSAFTSLNSSTQQIAGGKVAQLVLLLDDRRLRKNDVRGT